MSKIFESIYAEQLNDHFVFLFSDLLSAFRKGYNCESVLIHLYESWKNAVDKNETVAMVLMDLSKAFDCLPHSLLIAKLRSYKISENAVVICPVTDLYRLWLYIRQTL